MDHANLSPSLCGEHRSRVVVDRIFHIFRPRSEEHAHVSELGGRFIGEGVRTIEAMVRIALLIRNLFELAEAHERTLEKESTKA